GSITEHRLYGTRLVWVIERRRGAVCVHIVELVQSHARVLDRPAHRALESLVILRLAGEVVGITGGAVSDQLGVDAGTTREGVLQLLQDHEPRPFPHHETVAVLVELS